MFELVSPMSDAFWKQLLLFLKNNEFVKEHAELKQHIIE